MYIVFPIYHCIPIKLVTVFDYKFILPKKLENLVKPEFINPYVYEYQQGDVISGYIVIENASSKPIPFDMFVVLFEGVFMITNSDHGKSAIPVKIKKFWNYLIFQQVGQKQQSIDYDQNHVTHISGSILLILWMVYQYH